MLGPPLSRVTGETIMQRRLVEKDVERIRDPQLRRDVSRHLTRMMRAIEKDIRALIKGQRG